MSEEWKPIEVGRAEVRGVDPEASGLLRVDVPLDPRPDAEWAAVFGGPHAFDGPPGHSVSLDMHPPQLSGGTVRLRPPDNEVERYLESLKERVRLTNEHYERTVRPRLRRAADVKRGEEVEELQRIQGAQRRLDQLSDGG